METQVLWIPFLFLLVFVGGYYLLFPRISRRGLLFGVYVGEKAGSSDEARSITHSWYRGMAVWLVASLVAILLAGIYFKSAAASIAAIILIVIGFFVEYLRAYFRASRLRSEGAPIEAAAMIGMGEADSLLLPRLAIALGFAGGIFAIAYAWSHYPNLPSSVPTHFEISGKPDAWRAKSFFTVMLLPFMSLIMGAGLGGMSYLVGQAKRAIRTQDQGVSFQAQQRFRRVMSNFLAVVAFLVTGLLTLLSYGSIRVGMKEAPALPWAMDVFGAFLLIYTLVGSLFIAIKYGQGGSQLERSVSHSPLTDGLADNERWVLGMFYVNRDDPSIFVERRFGLGYTLNFGNRKAVALLTVFMGLVVLISILGILSK